MIHILSGITARNAKIESIKKEIEKLLHLPTLCIIQVGERSDSNAYINQKKALAQKIGAQIEHTIYPESISQKDLLKIIQENNTREDIHGIIVQMPLPQHLDKTTLIEAIAPEKDVDGLTSRTLFVPATARGILSLCDFYAIELKDKKITVIGKSALVGTPVAMALKKRGAIVTVCDKKTGDLIPFTKPADVIVVAAGSPKLITKEHVSPGQIVIDVGINERMIGSKRTLVGDVDFAEVEPIVAAITPVPGGVGPMTVISLLENLVESTVKKG